MDNTNTDGPNSEFRAINAVYIKPAQCPYCAPRCPCCGRHLAPVQFHPWQVYPSGPFWYAEQSTTVPA